jgi:hypothetical protein
VWTRWSVLEVAVCLDRWFRDPWQLLIARQGIPGRVRCWRKMSAPSATRWKVWRRPELLLVPTAWAWVYAVQVVLQCASGFIVFGAVTVVVAALAAVVVVRHNHDPRAGVLAASHAIVWTAVVAGAAAASLESQGVGFRSSEQAVGYYPLFDGGPEAPAVWPKVAVVAALLSAVVLLIRHRGDSACRVLAVSATALAFAVVAFALLHRPAPEDYVKSLSTHKLGELPIDSHLTMAGRTFRYQREIVELLVENGHETASVCRFEADGSAWTLRQHGGCGCPYTRGHNRPHGPTDCPTLTVSANYNADIVLVGNYIGFRLSDGSVVHNNALRFADRVARPPGWTLTAAFGGIVATFLLGLAHQRRRRAALAGQEAYHLGDGRVTLANGATRRVEAALHLPIGAVVLTELSCVEQAYRTNGPMFVAATAGTLRELEARRTDLAASLESIALAAAILASAPLFVVSVFDVIVRFV